VYDFGSRNKKRGAPRALWYGLEFMRYVLMRLWYPSVPATAFLRGHDVSRAFDREISGLNKTNIKKMKYYRQYVTSESPPGGSVPLYGVYSSTEHDTDSAYYQAMAARWGAELIDFRADGKVSERHFHIDPSWGPIGLEHCRRIHPIESMLGMRLFLGGISHASYDDWHDGI